MVGISLGYTFDYFYTGLVITGLAIYLGYEFHPLCLIIIPIGVIVFLSPKRIEFDVEKLKRRIVYNFFGIKVGSWMKYAEDDELWLIRASDFRDAGNISRGGLAKWGTSGYVNFFKIMLATDQGDIEIDTFTDYNEALECLHKYGPMLKMKMVDDYSIKLNESLSKERR